MHVRCASCTWTEGLQQSGMGIGGEMIASSDLVQEGQHLKMTARP